MKRSYDDCKKPLGQKAAVMSPPQRQTTYHTFVKEKKGRATSSKTRARSGERFRVQSLFGLVV